MIWVIIGAKILYIVDFFQCTYRERPMKTFVPVELLDLDMYEQLEGSKINPPTCLTIHSYEVDGTTQAVMYEICVGCLRDDVVEMHTVKVRFSELLTFDKKVRPSCQGVTSLCKFPPKTLFRTTDALFLEKRAAALGGYLENLTRLPGIASHPAFQQVFSTC